MPIHDCVESTGETFERVLEKKLRILPDSNQKQQVRKNVCHKNSSMNDVKIEAVHNGVHKYT